MLILKVLLPVILFAKISFGLHDGRETCQNYSNEWVVHFDGTNGSFNPNILAEELGYQNMGEVINLE